MRIFVDANVLVTVLCNEYPRFSACARVLSLCDHPHFNVYTSPLYLGIAYYFSEKKNGTKAAREKIMLLCRKLKIADMEKNVVCRAAENKAVKDFEDGMQYYSAVDADCRCIVTYDKRDYYFSEIDVQNPEEFLLKYVARKS